MTRSHTTSVERAQRLYVGLCASQTSTRLLHGDLHHYNILRDGDRGWVAIDPKGVVGEVEYEIGAALRNPYGAGYPETRVAEPRAPVLSVYIKFLNVALESRL